MSSREMRRLIESMEAAQVTTEREQRRYEGDPNGYLKSFIEMYDGEDPMDNGVTTDELIRKAVKMGGGDPAKSGWALYDLTSEEGTGSGTKYGDSDLSDMLKSSMIMDKLTVAFPDKADELYKAWRDSNGSLQAVEDEMPEMEPHIEKMS